MARSAADRPAPTDDRGESVPPDAPRVAGWEPIVEAIGPKVRDLRQRSGLSLQQLARRADVSAAAIHKVERGDMVPTVTTLLKLAAALERPVGHFVDDGIPAPVASLVPADARPALPSVGTSVGTSGGTSVVRSGITGPPERFRLAGAVTTVGPHATGGGDARHAGEELVHVLEGVLEFEVAGERYRVGPGDTLQYPADRHVQWGNPDEDPARAIWLSTRGS